MKMNKLDRSELLFIGITGQSGAGKTTVAKLISSTVGTDIVVISLDSFYKKLPFGVNGDDHDWDSPDAYDWKRLMACMDGWRAGAFQYIPEHVFASYGTIDNHEKIEPARTMIFEGIHILANPEIVSRLDLQIYVDCDPDEALARRITRDIKERGYALDLVLMRYFKFVKPAYKRWIKPTKKQVDFIIPNCNDLNLAEHSGIQLIIDYTKRRLV
jgi:uridine kinase